MEAHVELVSIAEIGSHILGPLIGFTQQDPARILFIHESAQLLQVDMGLWQVFAVGAFTLEEVRYGIGAEPVDAKLEPEPRDLHHLFLDLGIVVIQIGLAGIEPVPEVLTCHFVPGPVGWLCVEKNDARFFVFLVRVAPDVIVSVGGMVIGAGVLKPRMLVGGVIEHKVHDDADAARVGGVQ